MNRCEYCGKEIDDKHKFCNSSCAARYNNAHRTRKSWTWTEEQKKAFSRKRIIANGHDPDSLHKTCKYCAKELGVEERTVCKECQKYNKHKLYKKLGIVSGSLKQRYEEALHTLKKLYFEDQLSSLEIHALTGVNFRTMRDLFRENGIFTRTLSEGNRLALELGKTELISCPKYLHGYHTTWENKKVFYRSSYELKFAEILDIKKIPYQMESLRIRYFDSQKGVERIAIPDFYLPDTNEIVEVKSNYTLDYQEMKDKFKAYKALGYLPKLILNGKEASLA